MTVQGDAQTKLSELLATASLKSLSEAQLGQFAIYLALLQKWNARLNLTAIRDEESILSRHFVECIACAQLLPTGIDTLLDFGSGAGFPGIPIGLCRPEISVTLAESRSRKAAFLQEALRSLSLTAKVFSGRAESLEIQFDCVTLRAVDKIESATKAAARLVRPGGWLAPLTTNSELPALQAAAGSQFQWLDSIPLPSSDERILALGIHTR